MRQTISAPSVLEACGLGPSPRRTTGVCLLPMSYTDETAENDPLEPIFCPENRL